MKTKISFILLFTFVALISHGQTNKEKTKLLAIEKLKVQAQYEMDSVKLAAENKLMIIKNEAHDSIAKIKIQADIELAALK
jgi:hypothetical protein